MNNNPYKLHNLWSSINFYDGGTLKVSIKHVLDWYLGYRSQNEKMLLIVSDKEPDMLAQSKSIEVLKTCRGDGKWMLSLILKDKEQDDVFETLCYDLILYSQSSDNENKALKLLFKRYNQWNLLLKAQGKHVIDEKQRKGLLGELIFLCDKIEKGLPADVALKGWIGPEGGDQDFVYDKGWYEIKSVGSSASAVSISSLQQLGNYAYGELVVMRIDKSSPEMSDAISLAEQVDKAYKLLNHDVDLFYILEDKLIKYGYIDLPEYKKQKYYLSGCARYIVSDEFPRLTSFDISDKIIAAQYSISLPGISCFKLEDK